MLFLAGVDQDAYDLLRDYNIPFEEDDFLYAENIPQKWKSLLEEASQVEQLLAPVKENFKEVCENVFLAWRSLARLCDCRVIAGLC